VVLLLALSALALVCGHQFLAGKIAAGDRHFAEGRRALEKGEPELEEGKARLEAGKLASSEGKKEYKAAAGNRFLVWADKWLRAGKGFRNARDRIVEGDRQIAEGEDKVDLGEKRIDAGKLELRQGGEQLRLARVARFACAGGALFFACAAIWIGLRRRRFVIAIFSHRYRRHLVQNGEGRSEKPAGPLPAE
jgi:hypothetical protein